MCVLIKVISTTGWLTFWALETVSKVKLKRLKGRVKKK